MPAERRCFDDVPESIVYWDSSFAIAFLNHNEAYHAECFAFQEKLKSANTLSVISDFVLDELAFWILKGQLVTEARRTGKRWQEVRRQRPDFVRLVFSQVATKRGELEAQTLRLPLPDSVTDRAFQLMHDHALLPTDAYHIATALENEVPACVTLDEDFLTVEGLIVYTCLP
jgi:predicted nucleic acid-binding protein